jgi:hypothetical protein
LVEDRSLHEHLVVPGSSEAHHGGQRDNEEDKEQELVFGEQREALGVDANNDFGNEVRHEDSSVAHAAHDHDMSDALDESSAFAQRWVDAVHVRVCFEHEVAGQRCELGRQHFEDAGLVEVDVLLFNHLVVLHVLTVLLLQSDPPVATPTPVAWLDHHPDAHVRLHETLQVRRVHDVAQATHHFLILLIDFEHVFRSILVGLAENLHLQRDSVYVLNVFLDCIDSKRKHQVSIPVSNFFLRIVFKRHPRVPACIDSKILRNSFRSKNVFLAEVDSSYARLGEAVYYSVALFL